jgi:predicted XRE-type DNA-binding protein
VSRREYPIQIEVNGSAIKKATIDPHFEDKHSTTEVIMAFPSKKRVETALKKLEKVDGTLALSENPTALEKFRWDLCQKFIKYKFANDLAQKELAKLLGVDESKVSKILHHRIDEFSTDRLIALYEKLDPKVKLKVG